MARAPHPLSDGHHWATISPWPTQFIELNETSAAQDRPHWGWDGSSLKPTWMATIRDVALALFLAVAISGVGTTWINHAVPGVWPSWLGQD